MRTESDAGGRTPASLESVTGRPGRPGSRRKTAGRPEHRCIARCYRRRCQEPAAVDPPTPVPRRRVPSTRRPREVQLSASWLNPLVTPELTADLIAPAAAAWPVALRSRPSVPKGADWVRLKLDCLRVLPTLGRRIAL